MANSNSNIHYLDHVTDGVILINEDFTIVFVNKVFVGWVGQSADTLVGKAIDDAFPMLTAKKFWPRFKRLFKMRAPMVLSALIHHCFVEIQQNNDEVMMQDTFVSVLQGEHGLEGLISIANVSEHNKSLMMVKDSAKQIKTLAESKMSFLSTISHDIRNPLNGIIGSTELLLDEPLNDAQTKLVHGIKDSGDFLLTLIKDFVDLTRVSSNQLRFAPEVFSLKEFFHNVIDVSQVGAKAKGLRFVYELDFDYEQTIYIDKSRLYQIVENLVSNAIKFTAKGFVKLRINADNDQLTIVVKDSGSGVSVADQVSIFDSFKQAKQGLEMGNEGFGLGLSIVKSIVTLLDGKIRVHSQEGLGSTFIVTLPLTLPPEGYGIEAVISQAQPDLTGIRVLVAEDNQISQHILISFIEKLGASVTIAIDGFAACKCLNEGQYDVVLLDDNMPFKTGTEVYSFAKSLTDYQQVPFVITSGNALEEDNDRYTEHGFDFILSKPYSFKDVVELFNRMSLDI